MYVFVRESCSFRDDGVPVSLSRGEVFHADDPLVKAHPELFTATAPKVRSSEGWTPPSDDVEEATANPGQRRNARRGR